MVSIAGAIGLLDEDWGNVAPLLKILYGENIEGPSDGDHPGFVLLMDNDKSASTSFLIPLLPETICGHILSKKTFQSILVTSNIVRDSFVGSETVPVLFKHDINTRPGTIEVILPKQPA